MEKFYTYILYSETSQKYYVGQTNNLTERIERHNAGYVSSTMPYRPWKIVFYCEKPDRAAAMALEKKLKNLSKKRIELFIEKYSAGPVADEA
ncbi:MAG: GIY-YIG nuclease family protein [Bacteroidales bacterium]